MSCIDDFEHEEDTFKISGMYNDGKEEESKSREEHQQASSSSFCDVATSQVI